MDDMEWSSPSSVTSCHQCDSLDIPGAWFDNPLDRSTLKRKAVFETPAPKRTSPPRTVQLSNVLHTLDFFSPVRFVKRVISFATNADADEYSESTRFSRSDGQTGDAKHSSNTQSASNAPFPPTHSIAQAQTSKTAHPERNAAYENLFARPHPQYRQYRDPIMMKLSQSSIQSSSASDEVLRNKPDMEQAKRQVRARAALLSTKQPKKDSTMSGDQDDKSSNTVERPQGEDVKKLSSSRTLQYGAGISAWNGYGGVLRKVLNLTPVRSYSRASEDHAPSPSLQLLTELGASLAPSDSESDTSSAVVDPSWTRPSTHLSEVRPRSHSKSAPAIRSSQAGDDGGEEIKPHQVLQPPPINKRYVPSELRTSSPDDRRRNSAQMHGQSDATESTKDDDRYQQNQMLEQVDKLSYQQAGKSPDDVPLNNQTDTTSTLVAEKHQQQHRGHSGLESELAKLNVTEEHSDQRNIPKAIRHVDEKTKRLTRAQIRKKQLEEEALNQYEIVPLTHEWDEKVREAVRRGHGNYAASDLARAVPEYAGRGQDNWLNDEVINGYLNIVTAHGKKNDRPNQTPSYHAFNSFFYNNLSSKGADSVMRWSKRPKINGTNLLNVEAVFVPINSGVHWTLAVVEPKRRLITHYNSMRSTALGVAACGHLKKWVAKELGKDFREEEWTLIVAGESPQQTNSDDCGVFTITSARQIMLGFKPMSYRAGQMKVQRKRIVAELINGALLKSREDHVE